MYHSVDCRKNDTSKMRQILKVVSRKVISKIAKKKRNKNIELSPSHTLSEESSNSKEGDITKLLASLTLSDKSPDEQGNKALPLLPRIQNFHDIKCNANVITREGEQALETKRMADKDTSFCNARDSVEI